MTTCARCGAELAEGVRFCSSCGAAVAQGGLQAPVRKHVVILFCDIVGSTTLGEAADPEALRERLARYFDAVSKVIWDHGGTVEKFIGDAVMAVFGVPSTREDDAVRAVRAAGGIHDAVSALAAELGIGLHVRIGVNSGEVFVTHQPDGQFSVTGDAVNTAQRLEAAAGTDETYVGDTVAELVRDRIVLDDVGEILHKGKTVPQQVFRVAADQDRVLEVREPAFVGRAPELADLTALADRAAARKEGWLLTYVGDAGIGKSRLIRQFARSRDGGVRVVSGACDAMSTGAFAPLAGWLGSLAGDWEAYVDELLGDRAPAVLQRLRSAVGRSDAQTSVDDVVWAVHSVLAAMCESSVVASVWDDLHWATDAQLDFIAQAAAASRNLPVLTVCLTRPEIFDAKPAWGGGRKSRVEDVVPLDTEDMLAIAAERIAVQAGDLDVTAEDLVARADGNPQVVQLLAQSAAAGEALPASVTQLYEAALDRLATDERALAETAAVYGRRFPLVPVAVVAEVTDAAAVVDRLRSRNVLEVAGDNDYRFAQAVFQQTTYRTMPKRTRITRHSAIADWIAEHRDEVAADAVSLVASHRVCAYELLQEIDGPAQEQTALRERAAHSAMEQLQRLQLRGDPSLPDTIDQALDVLQPGDPRHVEVACSVAIARNSGTDQARFLGWLDRVDTAMEADESWQIIRTAPRHVIDIRSGELSLQDAHSEATRIVERLAACPAQPAGATDLAMLYLSQVEADLGRLWACHEHCVAALARLEDDDRPHWERIWRNFDLQISYAGLTPLSDTIADARTLQTMVAGHRGLWGTTTAILAVALACAGQFEAAEQEWAGHRRALEDVLDYQLPYDLQHYARTLLAEGRVHEAADYWLSLLPMVEHRVPIFAASILGSAAEHAILAGDLTMARECVARLTHVGLPPSLDWVLTDSAAFTRAVDAALRGERETALEQVQLGATVDRPEESLTVAGFVRTMTAVVEHLLGDETASRAAAASAKEAFDAKGALALRDQVDSWVSNADKLRTTASTVR